MKEKILLHTCCAPCGGYLSKEFFKNFQPVLFFYNPNIWPKEEYDKRLEEIKKFCQREKIELIVDQYENLNWLALTTEHKKDKEGGERCQICFAMRLEKTAQRAKELGLKNFSTTLAISPFKNLAVLKEIGEQLAEKFNLKFVIFPTDSKNELWQATEKFAQAECFYHQNYCGCLYSLSLFKFFKNFYNNNMHDTKWDNLIFMIEEKFGIKNRGKESVEVNQDAKGESIMGELESVEFETPGGLMKLERIGRPKVIDKKVLSTKRIGGKVAVDYVYSPDEKSYEVKLYRFVDDQWQEVNLAALV